MKVGNQIRMTSENKVSGISYVEKGTNLCRLPNGLICIGCCGFDFAKNLNSKQDFIKALVKSTGEFSISKEVISFKKRYSPDDLHDCGLCRQLILKDLPLIKGDLIDSLSDLKYLPITCALHPAENNGEEFRKGECDLDFMCETQKMFLEEWGDWTKNKFIKFVYSKDLDWFEYSKKMHDNSLVKEFFDIGIVSKYDK